MFTYIIVYGVLFVHTIQTHPPFEKEFLNSTELLCIVMSWARSVGGSVSIEAVLQGGDVRHFGLRVYPYIHMAHYNLILI